ncbi:efflux RND transporter periplasmic adaptor subunit [Acinetobacter qingfengensis]|uniref:Multidrug transporter subunit MdtA n=1 Tax=Acinetobacter qingfengensis TaxID=1262585 RepID=A0A1E7RF12_9GAMM|nr:efflux RND transporter periplasmic adaptor subunit [Acinetobacter qingfengensis]KAA8735669.1 efflux RND transporter periplasmic adaptor subunit [Acinetobacter qingfengensis]OEY97886.1 multidrug transporter subunit MdtA [Acinetobacter qingfengensis]
MAEQNKELNSGQTPQKKWWRLFIFLLVILLLAFLLWKFVLKPKPKADEYSQWRQPVPVEVVALSRENLQLELKAVGTAIPSETITVQSRVAGILKQLYFKDGDLVEKGQLLALVDPEPMQVTLNQSKANQQNIIAQLQYAESELKRKQNMLKYDAISRQEVDQQAAQVRQLSAQLQSLKAQVDASALELSYSKIYAPISGQLGFRQKDVGNLIQENEENGLVTITKTSPIYVEFAISENYLNLLRGQATQAKPLLVEAWDRDEKNLLAQGEVFALDNQIDASTGTLKLKARFNNADHQLFANQFVNVRLKAQTIANAVTVPSDAIQHGSKGTYVYIIDQQNKAQIKMLQLGMATNGKTQVLSGLNGNERVVLEGIDRLAEGRQVNVLKPAQNSTATKGQ